MLDERDVMRVMGRKVVYLFCFYEYDVVHVVN